MLAGSGSQVCIVCPRGCMISEKSAPCPRGEAYFAETKKGLFQPMTTTIGAIGEGKRSRLPVKSLRPVEVARIPSLKAELSKAAYSLKPGAESLSTKTPGAKALDARLSIPGEDGDIEFSVCR
jgi:CxxC motif-containing protein